MLSGIFYSNIEQNFVDFDQVGVSQFGQIGYFVYFLKIVNKTGSQIKSLFKTEMAL